MNLSKNAFTQRGQSLENEFFHRVDQELIRKLNQKAATDKGRERLALVTGISDQQVLNELLDAGINAETLVALTIVPLVHVAWANRVLDTKERAAVLKAAHQAGIPPESASHQLLDAWLKSKPDDKLFEVWQHYTAALVHHSKPEQVTQLSDDIVRRARNVAKTTGGFLGIGSISDAEESVLEQIKATFESAE